MALNADVAVMQGAAQQLGDIRDEVVTALGRYVTMNQNLTGAGFAGNAALASLASTEDIARTGQQVTVRFGNVISEIQKSAQRYDQEDAANRAALSAL